MVKTNRTSVCPRCSGRVVAERSQPGEAYCINCGYASYTRDINDIKVIKVSEQKPDWLEDLTPGDQRIMTSKVRIKSRVDF
jgi:hypothetical protein